MQVHRVREFVLGRARWRRGRCSMLGAPPPCDTYLVVYTSSSHKIMRSAAPSTAALSLNRRASQHSTVLYTCSTVVSVLWIEYLSRQKERAGSIAMKNRTLGRKVIYCTSVVCSMWQFQWLKRIRIKTYCTVCCTDAVCLYCTADARRLPTLHQPGCSAENWKSQLLLCSRKGRALARAKRIVSR